jgi:hypothetical protein
VILQDFEHLYVEQCQYCPFGPLEVQTPATTKVQLRNYSNTRLFRHNKCSSSSSRNKGFEKNKDKMSEPFILCTTGNLNKINKTGCLKGSNGKEMQNKARDERWNWCKYLIGGEYVLG